ARAGHLGGLQRAPAPRPGLPRLDPTGRPSGRPPLPALLAGHRRRPRGRPGGAAGADAVWRGGVAADGRGRPGCRASAAATSAQAGGRPSLTRAQSSAGTRDVPAEGWRRQAGVLFPPALLDAGSAAAEAAQVVEAGAPDLATTDDLHLLDAGRVAHEGPLDANAAGDLSDCEGGRRAAVADADDVSLEHLDALAVALDDLR